MPCFLAQEQKWPGLGRTDGLDDESAFKGSGLNFDYRYNNFVLVVDITRETILG